MLMPSSARSFVIAVTATLAAIPVSVKATDSDPGIWVTFSATDAFQSDQRDSRWHYWFDTQARYFDLGSGINQWLARPGIGYEFDNGVKGWIGYARFRARNRAGKVADENRYWQQLDWSAGRWMEGKVSIRVRLEQRSVSVGEDTGVVLRLLTKYARPVGSGKTSLIVGLEPFVDLKDTDWGGDSGLGQNRLFLGLAWSVTEKLSIEFGYMNQYFFADSGEDRVNHLGIVGFKLRP